MNKKSCAHEETQLKFCAFGRSAAALTISKEDERLLSGTPEPLTIVVPVQIDTEEEYS